MSYAESAPSILLVSGGKSPLLVPEGLCVDGMSPALHRVAEAHEVLPACRRLSPDLVLVDAPTVAGPLGLLADVAAADLPWPPALLLVADDPDGRMRDQALGLGAWDLLPRPVDRATLLARVGLCLRARLKHRGLAERVQKLEYGLNDRNQRLADAMDLLRAAERRLSELARQSEGKLRQRSDMMASAAHELRTPLHAIIGFADLIRQEAYGKVGDPRYAEYADDIHQAARQLLELVDGTLDLARAESGADGLEIREVDIGRAVQDSVRMLRQLADGSGVTLRVVVPDTPLRIKTDPEKVRQIVLNLASNAIKFTPAGGTVTVEVARSPDDGAIIMVVRDTGIGMSSQDIPTALRPFGQVRRPDRPHPKGTGLGLPLTKRFVELLGGRLDIESQPGKGTMVRVVLPAAAPQSGGMAQAEVA